jgi:hypothetical protein
VTPFTPEDLDTVAALAAAPWQRGAHRDWPHWGSARRHAPTLAGDPWGDLLASSG